MSETIPNGPEEVVSSQRPEGYIPDSEEVLYEDPATGLIHKFPSSKEKMEFLEEKHDPSNK